MGMDDRRFVSCNVLKGRVGDGEYFKAIHDQMENGGLEALMYDLLQEDLSGWNPRQRPRSAIRHALDQKLMSMSPLEKFIFQWVVDKEVEKYRRDEERIGLYRVPHSKLYDEYTAWCDQMKIQHRLDTKTFSLKVWGKLIPYEHAFRYEGRKTVDLVPSAENIIDYYEREVIRQELP